MKLIKRQENKFNSSSIGATPKNGPDNVYHIMRIVRILYENVIFHESIVIFILQ